MSSKHMRFTKSYTFAASSINTIVCKLETGSHHRGSGSQTKKYVLGLNSEVCRKKKRLQGEVPRVESDPTDVHAGGPSSQHATPVLLL